MATAPHVSRVSKDYTPHGYSIRRTKMMGMQVASGGANGGGAHEEPCDLLMNGDVNLLRVSILTGYNTAASVADDATHNWTIEVISDKLDGNPAIVLATVNTFGIVDPAGVIGKYDFNITDPIVTAPGTLGIRFTETSGTGLGTQKDIQCSVWFEFDSKA